VIYYFCNIKNEQDSRTASAILRALIVQLCEDRRLFKHLPNRFQNKNESRSFHSASFDDLWRTFNDLLSIGIYTYVYCVIDGLDVYETQMDDLLSNLKKSMTSDKPVLASLLKLFCTSRPSRAVEGISPMRILRASERDLEVFINGQLESFPSVFVNDMKEVVRESVMRHADKTFLWISIVLRELRNLDYASPADIEKTIDGNPQELTKLYDSLVQKTCARDERNVAILTWITYAKRPLHVKELEIAITVTMNSNITCWEDCCKRTTPLNSEVIRANMGTLIDIIDDSPFFIHQSLRDYLTERDISQQSHIISKLGQGDLVLGRSCMKFLSFKFGETLSMSDENRYPLLNYASLFWYKHIHTVDEVKDDAKVLQNVFKGTGRRRWMHLRRLGRRIWSEEEVSIWQMAISYDIGWFANMLLNTNSFEETLDSDCLLKAAESAPGVLKELLYHPDIKKIKLTEDVVKVVARNWDSEVMELLLEQRGDEVKITEEVVKAAAGNWHGGKKVMGLLLEQRGDEVNITEEVVREVRSFGVMILLLEERGDEVRDIIEAIKETITNMVEWEAAFREARQREPGH
jgi:hypothetical protein